MVAAEQVRSETAKAFKGLVEEGRSQADALARASGELASFVSRLLTEPQTLARARAALNEAAKLGQAQQEQVAKAEAEAAANAQELQRVKSESSKTTKTPETEQLRTLRLKLDAEVQTRRIAQEKIAQLQHEMAGYRQVVENPAALHEAEGLLAKRVKELAVAEERVRVLTEELQAVRAANPQGEAGNSAPMERRRERCRTSRTCARMSKARHESRRRPNQIGASCACTTGGCSEGKAQARHGI